MSKRKAGMTPKPFSRISGAFRFVFQRPANFSVQTGGLQVSLTAFLAVQMNLALAHQGKANGGERLIDNRAGVSERTSGRFATDRRAA